MTQKCAARVYEPPQYIHSHRCTRMATMTRQDDRLRSRPVCTQHGKGPLAPYWWDGIR